MAERPDHRMAAARAIRSSRKQVRWKPGKDIQHLEKRKARGHLPIQATLDDYNLLISSVLSGDQSLVYYYAFGAVDYYAVAGEVGAKVWLVILGADAILETAFPPEDFSAYLAKHAFVRLGRMEEITDG